LKALRHFTNNGNKLFLVAVLKNNVMFIGDFAFIDLCSLRNYCC